MTINNVMHVASKRDDVRHYAVFGENNWDHIQIHTIVDPELGAAGMAIGVSGR